MTTLYTIYGIGVNGSRYRSRLKTRIKNQFQEDAIFCPVSRNSPDIIVILSLSLSEVIFQDRDSCTVKVAEYLRNDIMSWCHDSISKMQMTRIGHLLSRILKGNRHRIIGFIPETSSELTLQ